ncbi:MAG TPA: hypothetical protein VHT72_07500 [Puia sp.]|jgi:hypothetical protein|nr:hypothetical protein [Puia sp.]
MSTHIEIDGVHSRPSAQEMERRGHSETMGDHELYEIINSAGDGDESESSDAVRRLYFGMLDLQRGMFSDLRLRISNVRSVADAVRTVDVFSLAWGHTTVCGAKTPAELAKKWGKPKETISKPLHEIIEKFNLPKLPGQRKDEANARMAAARHESIRLKKETDTKL